MTHLLIIVSASTKPFLVHSCVKAMTQLKKLKQFNDIYMGKVENLNISGKLTTTGI